MTLDDGTTLPVDTVSLESMPGRDAWIAVGPALGSADDPRAAVAVAWTGAHGRTTTTEGGSVG